MIETIILVVFVLGYLAIAFEHTLKLDKLIPALIMMAVMWGLISYFDLTVLKIGTKTIEDKPIIKILDPNGFSVSFVFGGSISP